MDRLFGAWLPVWRSHRWVFALWVLAAIGVVVELAGIATQGFDSPILWVALLVVLMLQAVLQWIVARYERRDLRISQAGD